MKIKLISSVFVVGAIAGACGGGGGGGLSAKGAVDEQLDIICASAFECKADYPADAPIPHDQLFGANEAACKTSLGANLSGADVQVSVDAGRITYDAGDAQACIDFIDGLSCTDFWGSLFKDTPPQPAVCDTAFVGTVADGGTCTTDLDCSASGSSCNSGTCGPG